MRQLSIQEYLSYLNYMHRRVLLLLVLMLSSCQWTRKDNLVRSPEVSTDLSDIRKRGTLTALVDNNSVSYFIYKGVPMGFEYELLQRVCQHLKLDLKIKVISSIEEAVNMLNTGQGDVLAFPLTITEERTHFLSFTRPHFANTQVLVQRKPEGWKSMAPSEVERSLLRDPVQLIGQEVHVKHGSSFKDRLGNLSEEIGGAILVREDSIDAETESLIRAVAQGNIRYTVADQTIAMVNSFYYDNIDVQTALSLPQQIAWAVRTNSPDSLKALNDWSDEIKGNGIFQVIYTKYFATPRNAMAVIQSDYSSHGGNKLSPYDDQIRKLSELLGWDWRLLASVVYQESHFQPGVVSWAGAVGLMQLLPETGSFFQVSNLYDPRQNLNGGVKFLKYLDDYWAKSVTDPGERIKFVLASYNAGLSHIIDSKNLARKYGKNPARWEQVGWFLAQKTNPKYYRDPVAPAGYCRCEGALSYVKEILQRYDEYKVHFR